MGSEKPEVVLEEYVVVINDEEQYSIWFSERDPPIGWRSVGICGSKQVCLEYISSVWTDMRPASLRGDLN